MAENEADKGNQKPEEFEVEEIKDDLEKVSGGAALSCDGCDGCSEPGCAHCSSDQS